VIIKALPPAEASSPHALTARFEKKKKNAPKLGRREKNGKARGELWEGKREK